MKQEWVLTKSFLACEAMFIIDIFFHLKRVHETPNGATHSVKYTKHVKALRY